MLQKSFVNTPASILIIEDDISIRESLTWVLESEGYLVASAENGQCGLDYLLSTQTLPAFILLDLQMPVMNGSELLEILKAHSVWKNIPTALFSGAESKFIPESANLILQKPIHLDHLLKTVSQFARIA